MFFLTNLISLLIWLKLSTRRFQRASKEELHLIYKTMKVDAYNYSNNLTNDIFLVDTSPEMLSSLWSIFTTVTFSFCKISLVWRSWIKGRPAKLHLYDGVILLLLLPESILVLLWCVHLLIARRFKNQKPSFAQESKTLKDSHLCLEMKATAKMVKNRQRAGNIQNSHFQRAPSPSLVTIWRLFAIFAKIATFKAPLCFVIAHACISGHISGFWPY